MMPDNLRVIKALREGFQNIVDILEEDDLHRRSEIAAAIRRSLLQANGQLIKLLPNDDEDIDRGKRE